MVDRVLVDGPLRLGVLVAVERLGSNGAIFDEYQAAADDADLLDAFVVQAGRPLESGGDRGWRLNDHDERAGTSEYPLHGRRWYCIRGARHRHRYIEPCITCCVLAMIFPAEVAAAFLQIRSELDP